MFDRSKVAATIRNYTCLPTDEDQIAAFVVRQLPPYAIHTCTCAESVAVLFVVCVSVRVIGSERSRGYWHERSLASVLSRRCF